VCVCEAGCLPRLGDELDLGCVALQRVMLR